MTAHRPRRPTASGPPWSAGRVREASPAARLPGISPTDADFAFVAAAVTATLRRPSASCSSTRRRFAIGATRTAGHSADTAPARMQPGAQLHFTATAYCKGETTASGVTVRTGVAAADPGLLPVGTVVTPRHAGRALRRGLDDHGHRSRRAGPARRSLHVELPRGAQVRPAAGAAHGAAPRLESGEQRARPHWRASSSSASSITCATRRR